MRSMSPFASACLVQAVLVDGGWYWLCLLHYHTNNFQTFAQAQNNQHAETIALVQSVQWCTMSVLTSTHGAHRMPSQRLFGLIDQQKRCHTHCVGTLTFKPRLCIHAGSLIFSGMSSLHELRGKTVLARVIVISFVWFCDPLWSFVILRDPWEASPHSLCLHLPTDDIRLRYQSRPLQPRNAVQSSLTYRSIEMCCGETSSCVCSTLAHSISFGHPLQKIAIPWNYCAFLFHARKVPLHEGQTAMGLSEMPKYGAILSQFAANLSATLIYVLLSCSKTTISAPNRNAIHRLTF